MNTFKTTLKLLFSFCLILSYQLSDAQSDVKKIKSLEKSITELMELANCPGMAVAVVKKDKVIYSKGFGYRDIENKIPVTENTQFAIGSCTKAFTAAWMGNLMADEKLDLDKSPKDYSSNIRFFNDEMNSGITLRDMLTHRTGLPRHDLSWYLFPGKSREELIQRIAFHEPSAKLREAYQYNNFMFMACGYVAEKVSGTSWDKAMSSEFFTKLGMAHSTSNLEALKKFEDRAIGYETRSDNTNHKQDYYPIGWMSPAGAINSSALDMGQWLIAWLNEGKYKGEQVLNPDFMREAIRSQMVASSGFPGSKHPDIHLNNYGFAWDLSSYRGHYRVEHGGNIDGFTASTCFYPSDDLGIVVLVNQNYSSIPSYVRNIIADKLLGLSDGKWGENLRKKDKEKTGEEIKRVSDQIAGTSPSHSKEAYLGSYYNGGYGSFELVLRNDSLIAQFPIHQFWMRHKHYDVFELYELDGTPIDTTKGSNLQLNFASGDNGEIEQVNIKLEQAVSPIEFKRTPPKIELEASSLAQYVGIYDLQGSELKVSEKEGSLYLFVPGQPEYKLIPIEEHKFGLEDLEGFAVLFEKKENKITAVTLLQPQGNFRLPRK